MIVRGNCQFQQLIPRKVLPPPCPAYTLAGWNQSEMRCRRSWRPYSLQHYSTLSSEIELPRVVTAEDWNKKLDINNLHVSIVSIIIVDWLIGTGWIVNKRATLITGILIKTKQINCIFIFRGMLQFWELLTINIFCDWHIMKVQSFSSFSSSLSPRRHCRRNYMGLF